LSRMLSARLRTRIDGDLPGGPSDVRCDGI